MSIRSELKYITSKKFFFKYLKLYLIFTIISLVFSIYNYFSQKQTSISRANFILTLDNKNDYKAQNYNHFMLYFNNANKSQKFLINPLPNPALSNLKKKIEFFILFSNQNELDNQIVELNNLLDQIKIKMLQDLNQKKIESELLKKQINYLNEYILIHKNKNQILENNREDLLNEKIEKEKEKIIEKTTHEIFEELIKNKNFLNKFNNDIEIMSSMLNIPEQQIISLFSSDPKTRKKICQKFNIKMEIKEEVCKEIINNYFYETLLINNVSDNFYNNFYKKFRNLFMQNFQKNASLDYLHLILKSKTFFTISTTYKAIFELAEFNRQKYIDELKKNRKDLDQMIKKNSIFYYSDWKLVLVDKKILTKNIFHFIFSYFLYFYISCYIITLILNYKTILFKKY